MRIAVIVIIVLILGGMFIANVLQTNFKSSSSGIVFTKIYLRWVIQIARNMKDLAVTAYRMDWLPQVEQVGVGNSS